MSVLTTDQIIKEFGPADPLGSYLVSINLPYPMRLAWDKNVEVKTMRCHKKLAQIFVKIFQEILNTYGIEQIKALGLDMFGGCFVYRKMRNGQELSRHSWGIAVDLDPANNTNEQTAKNAKFAKAEYKALFDIFYKNGFINYGKEKGHDFMHFEFFKKI